MIEPSVIHRIQRLLAEGKSSQREIAKVAGVSRGTVAAVAGGRRPAYRVPSAVRENESAGPVQRCPGCGGMTPAPCRLCRARDLANRSRAKRPRTEPAGPLRLELNDEHQKRYLEVRSRRDRQAQRAGQVQEQA